MVAGSSSSSAADQLQRKITQTRVLMHAAAAPDREDYAEALRLKESVEQMRAQLRHLRVQPPPTSGAKSTAETREVLAEKLKAGHLLTEREFAMLEAPRPSPATTQSLTAKLAAGHLLTEREVALLEKIPEDAEVTVPVDHAAAKRNASEAAARKKAVKPEKASGGGGGLFAWLGPLFGGGSSSGNSKPPSKRGERGAAEPGTIGLDGLAALGEMDAVVVQPEPSSSPPPKATKLKHGPSSDYGLSSDMSSIPPPSKEETRALLAQKLQAGHLLTEKEFALLETPTPTPPPSAKQKPKPSAARAAAPSAAAAVAARGEAAAAAHTEGARKNGSVVVVCVAVGRRHGRPVLRGGGSSSKRDRPSSNRSSLAKTPSSKRALLGVPVKAPKSDRRTPSARKKAAANEKKPARVKEFMPSRTWYEEVLLTKTVPVHINLDGTAREYVPEPLAPIEEAVVEEAPKKKGGKKKAAAKVERSRRIQRWNKGERVKRESKRVESLGDEETR